MALSEMPRILTTQKPVRLVLVNGFLGAGKTTTLCALAKNLGRQGKHVGYVTNDQAAHLVDTAHVARQGIPVAEVAGGCFCCRFTGLLDAAQDVLDQGPDVLLCEPVGSCTDMAATVLKPLKHFYGDQFNIAPFAVLVDPARVRSIILGEAADAFPAEVGYIFRKQLEEADEILLNKVDRLTVEEARRYAGVLEERFGKPVRSISAVRGDGMDEWSAALLAGETQVENLLRSIDYDIYAQGEAVLGWLNATINIEGHPTFEPASFVGSFLSQIESECGRNVAEIAHVKLALTEGANHLRANLTGAGAVPEVRHEPWKSARQATMVLNVRVQMAPEQLTEIVEAAVRSACTSVDATEVITTLQSFSPSYPRPPYRMTASR